MRRDSLRTMLYCFARVGLYILINVFAVVVAKILILGIVGTFFPRLQLYYNTELLSFFSFLIPMALLIVLLADDAKRHTAYGTYNMTLVSIVMILTSAIYYLPVLLMQYTEEKVLLAGIENMYFSSYWLSIVDYNIEVYALLGIILQLIICIASYGIARKIYLKKFESGEYEYLYEE